MDIQKNKDLIDFNSFVIKATADYYVEVTSEHEIEAALDFVYAEKVPYLILGGGSNILFVNNFHGMIIHIKNKGIFWDSSLDNQKQRVDVSAGENWHNFVVLCLSKNLHGLENLALIPGTVGGAPIQNIGAYGVEVKDLIESVKVFDLTRKKWLILSNQDCGFGYRNSILRTSNRYIVYTVTFELERQWNPRLHHRELYERFHTKKTKAADIFNEVCRVRRTKLPDPKIKGNAGSFFKNPIISMSELDRLNSDCPGIPFYKTNDPDAVKVPAAWLLDNLGWRGKSLGGASVSTNHALVIVNQARATGRDIYDLAMEMSSSVFDNFEITLIPEVKIIDS